MTLPRTLKTLEVRDCAQWREWLADHHDSESEVWLVFYKRQTGRPSLVYGEALDEALCFGWIDSLIKRLDDERYARKFTPRKPVSKWSAVNRKRYALLQASGRLTPAGLARAPAAPSAEAPPPAPAQLPPYIQEGLQRQPAAWEYFQRLAPSCRRQYVGWIDSAKRQETKLRRLQEAIALLTAGKPLGMK